MPQTEIGEPSATGDREFDELLRQVPDAWSSQLGNLRQQMGSSPTHGQWLEAAQIVAAAEAMAKDTEGPVEDAARQLLAAATYLMKVGEAAVR